MSRWRASAWRREQLRTTLWLVPTIQIALAVGLFTITYLLDRAAAEGSISLPSLVNKGSADAARQLLTATAAAVITVVGLVFSITIVALTLASTQFGPRMLRNFVRDRGTQVTLGTFVSTFVYAVLALGAIAHGPGSDFVPHLSVTVALVLLLASLGVLVYFIHHIAQSIQLPEVIAGIARDLGRAVEADAASTVESTEAGPSPADLRTRLAETGVPVLATSSGYLQFVAYDTLVAIAANADAVIELLYRPGHFVVSGLPLATVWPPEAAPAVARSLARSHASGPHRTLTQDPAFAIDQLVEIAIRALSPAVNDTFTALTCIDWLCDGLCKLAVAPNPAREHRDRTGNVRVIRPVADFDRYVDRAFDKIRQAGRGMPAVMIRQLDALSAIAQHSTTYDQHTALGDQAARILTSSEESIPDEGDRSAVQRRHERLTGILCCYSS